MPPERGSAPLTVEQRNRKREIDRRSQQRIRQRRDTLLKDAEQAAGHYQSQVDDLSVRLVQAEARERALLAEIRELHGRSKPAQVAMTPSPSSAGSVNTVPRLVEASRDGPMSFNVIMHPEPFNLNSKMPLNLYSKTPLNHRDKDSPSDSALQLFLEECNMDIPLPLNPDLSCMFSKPPDTAPLPTVANLVLCLVLVLAKMPHIPHLPEKIANMWLLHKVSMWRVACRTGIDCNKAYECMPYWLRPSSIQYTSDHPPWMDHLPWPSLRAFLIDHKTSYDFVSFSDNYPAAFSVNWPRSDKATYVETWNPITSMWIKTISPEFERHLFDLNNWTIKPDAHFRRRFPELVEAIDRGVA